MEKDKKYSSVEDTKKHAHRVLELMSILIVDLYERGKEHDDSKMKSPELETFDKFTPKLKNCTFGSDEYKKYLSGMEVALKHHYENNRHHPEHYDNGIDGMDLLDLIEMVCDWKAATERHDDGDIKKSLDLNKSRFKIDDQLYNILSNTVQRYLK